MSRLATQSKRIARSQDQMGLAWVMRNVKQEAAVDDQDRTGANPVTDERLQIVQADIPHLSLIVRELVEHWEGPESDDYGRLRPTESAFEGTVALLVDAAITLSWTRHQVPHGCVSTDADGGIRIEWVRPSGSVHLVVPASKDSPAYIYHEVATNYATVDANAARLAKWLREIIGDRAT